MLLAQDADKQLALPATLELDLDGQSFDREVPYAQAEVTGRWIRARGPEIEYRSRVGLLDEGKGDGKSRAVFTTKLPKTGRYRVAVAFATGANRATRVPIVITHAGGEATITLNQKRKNSPFAFAPLGEFRFKAGEPATVTFTNEGADGAVIIDTVRWIWLGE
jgi:hypothetical protein